MHLHGPEDLATVRRRVKHSLDAHRRRAKADRQELPYAVEDLQALVQGADRCAYCGAWLTAATFALDHKTPTCRAADYSLGNLAVACGRCNLAKGALSAGEFTQLLALLDGFDPRGRADVLVRLRAGGRRCAGG